MSSLFRRKKVAKLGGIEDAIDPGFKSQNAGRLLLGGFGTERGYIDLLSYDGARSLEILRTILQRARAPAGAMIEFFAREKRARRIAL